MSLFKRKFHTYSREEVEAPDTATFVRLAFARHHSKRPTSWNLESDQMTWQLDQMVNGEWKTLGTSTTRGGVWNDPESGESEESWDETRLIPGAGRKVRVHVIAHDQDRPIDTEGTISWL